jgi:hypothetical protein
MKIYAFLLSISEGTLNVNINEAAKGTHPKSTHGLAFPNLVAVFSITNPIKISLTPSNPLVISIIDPTKAADTRTESV